MDIRHDITHHQLPSESVLRQACVEALAWVRANYWMPQVGCCHYYY